MVPGMYLAWCVNLQLVAPKLRSAFGREVLRLRYRELTPAAFFLKVDAAAASTDELLSEQGSAFAAHHYAQYRSRYHGRAL